MATTEKNLRPQVKNRPILRKKIWEACNRTNEHYVGGIVGREGSAKSYTALRIGELVDPNFSAEQVFFHPDHLLELIRDKSKDWLKGRLFVGDEAGVGLGNRTWYEDGQIKANQALQTVRDDNIALLMTLPRLEELDKQAKGRLKGAFKMTEKDEERMVATARYYNIEPSRMGQDKIYRKYMTVRRGGKQVELKRTQFKPPADDLVAEYEEKKKDFKDEFFTDAIESAEDGDGAEQDQTDYQGMADEVVANVNDFVTKHGHTGKEYLDKDMIQMEYDLSVRDAKKVKKLASREVDL